MLCLTQSAVSEELNVVCQTEVLHPRCRSLVNHRVLNLLDTQSWNNTQLTAALMKVERGIVGV